MNKPMMILWLTVVTLIGVRAIAGPADRQPNAEMPMNAAITASPTITTTSTLILPANPKRVGLILWNQSANSVYVAFAENGNSSTKMTLIIGAYSSWVMQGPIYRGPISGIRNSGTGPVVATELTP